MAELKTGRTGGAISQVNGIVRRSAEAWMMSQETSAEILARYGAGDEQAADELFSRYVGRLTLLARSRLAPKLSSRTDPEDVVMSAYRSFFIGAREGRFVLTRSGDL